MIVFVGTVFSQSLLVHKYTEEEGLPGSLVNSVLQDKDGYMFFATRNGIARYDGYKWQTDWKSIPKNQATSSWLSLDEDSNVWYFSSDGTGSFYKFDKQSWKLKTSIPQSIISQSADIYFPLAICNNKNKTKILIYIAEKGLLLFENSMWKKIELNKPGLEIYHIININGCFYLASSDGLLYLDKSNKLLLFDDSIPKGPIYSISVETRKNKEVLWILGKNFIGSHDFSRYTDFLSSNQLDLFIPGNKICLIPNYYNSIIVGSINRILQINMKTGRISEIGVQSGLIDGSARDIFLDREKNLWFASNRGVSKIPSLRFENFNNFHGLLEDEVTSVIELNYKLYFGHNKGVTIFENHGKSKQLLFDEINRNTRVLDMNISPFGEVYLAGSGNGLYKITADDKLVKIQLPDIYSTIQSVVFDNNGTMFVSSNSNVLSKTIYEKNFKKIFTTEQMVRKLFVDKSNTLWAATITSGIYCFKGEKVEHIRGSDAESNNVFAINFDLKDTILIGTNRGLAYINNNSIIPYKFSNLTIARPIYFIHSDSRTFWIGTDAGVFRRDKYSVRHYGVNDGLAGTETNRDAFWKDRQGYIWFGTNRGVSRYSRDFDNINVKKPICRIIDIHVNDQVYNMNQQVTLPGSHKNIVFDIEAISFINERKNMIKYKLEGFDTDWSKPQNLVNFELLYRKLPPGTYTLKVQVANTVGVWSDVVVSPLITVEKPFYLSTAFILIVLLVLLGLIYLIALFLSEKKYKNKLEHQVSVRTAQLAESELRYKQMFVDNNAYMLIIDPFNGKIIDANPSAMNYYGVSKSLVNEIFIFDLIAEFVENKIEFLETMTKQKAFSCKHKTVGDSVRDVVIHQSILDVNDRKVIYAIIEDVTERKIVEEKLRSLNIELEEIVKKRTYDLENALDELKTEINIRKKTEEELFQANEKLFLSLEKERDLGELKSRFISMISHEYRTPLTVILSSAYLVKESLKRGLNDEIDRHLFKIHASVTAMSRLLEDVLTYGKAEDGTLSVKISEIDLPQFVSEIVEEIQTVDQNKHNIVFDFKDDYLINSDKYLLRQIFVNLLLNSTKFSEKGSSIFIELKAFKTDFSLIIKDEGKGISDDDLTQIFNPFFRNEKSIGIIPGTGLGLAIVKRCVDVLSGSIKVNNKVEKGVIFTVTLPINNINK